MELVGSLAREQAHRAGELMYQYDVFLSYSSVDEDVVEGFAERLREAGERVFFAPWELVPGARWLKALEQALEGSRTCAVFVGPGGLGPWHSKEMEAALDQRVAKEDEEEDKRVIPVLLPGSSPEDIPTFLKQRTWVDFRRDLTARRPWDRLLWGIRGTPGGSSRVSVVANPPLPTGQAPAWASDSGQDRFGEFAEIKVGDAIQRLRWISPGTFQMGSPETEAGRRDDEGPRHEVTLTKGFWLGDTPCTQALWQAVMGKNPSDFPDPDRPVEKVSWENCRTFFDRLTDVVPGFKGDLPTEAQWEYACRAGTPGATWLGDLEILGEWNAPLLDTIAWYGGNSGHGYDLQVGYDSSFWQEKQYPHAKAGTRKVKGKQANPWGLYDMLGNVWEWCLDEQDFGRSYPGGPRQDPVFKDGAVRVIRGCSWNSRGGSVRAANRDWGRPGGRHVSIGFRLSQGPKPGQAR